MPANDIIRIRRGTSSEWTAGNPTLSSGELGYDTTLKLIKVGDGTTAWSGLPYFFANSGNLISSNGSSIGINNPSPSGRINIVGSGLFSTTTGISPNALLHAYSATSGDTVLNIEGTNGSLFSILDNLSGTLMAVNNSAGLPVLEVFSDDSVVAGRFNQNDLVVSSGGNVGMGTSSPTQKLDVRGNANVSGSITSSGSITAGSTITAASGLTVSNGSILVTGNITSTAIGTFPNIVTTGISATSSWGYNLTISNSNGDGSIILRGTNAGSSPGGVKIYPGKLNAFYVYDSGEVATFGFGGDGTLFGSQKLWNGGIFTIRSADGSANVNAGHLRIKGGDAGSHASFASNGGDIYIQGGNKNTLGAGSYGEIYFRNPSGTAMHIVKSDGTFGIGTTTPSGQLHVIGTGLISSRLGIGTSTPSGHLHVNGSGFIGGTGISPNATLHVYSSTSGNTIFNAEGTNGSLFSVVDNLSGALMSVNTIAGLPIFQVNSDYSISGGRYNQNDFVITSGGNIGIGTGSPTQKLDVRGSAYVSGNIQLGDTTGTAGNRVQFYRGGGAVYDYSISKEGNHLAISTANDGSTIRYTQFGYHSGSTWTPKVVINNYNGAIGVGTTSPTYQLHIVGSGFIASGLSVSGSLTLNGTGVSLSGHTHASTDITDFTEAVQDVVGTGFIVAGSGITVSYNDAGNSFTISSSGGGGGGGITDVVQDTTPQLGGNLDLNSYSITGVGNININGTGTISKINLDSNILSSTSGNLVLSPSGNAALIGISTGNARGIYATDWQRETTSVTQVASGSNSVIGGGKSNTANGNYSTVGGGVNNVASGLASTVAGGNSNTSSSYYSVVGGGNQNTASSYYTTVAGGLSNDAIGDTSTIGGGGNNSAEGIECTVGGGQGNLCTSKWSTIPGGASAKASRHGELAHAAGFFLQKGDAQHSVLIARRSTTDATANQVLFLDNSSARLTLTEKTTWTFEIKLSAYNDTDSAGAGWIFRGAIRRDGANGTALVGSLIEENWKDTAMNSAVASVVADDTNEALEIRVTGLIGKNIRWVAVVDISQVSYGTP